MASTAFDFPLIKHRRNDSWTPVMSRKVPDSASLFLAHTSESGRELSSVLLVGFTPAFSRASTMGAESLRAAA
ncbi:hypothetical protein BOTNAR_0240g00160 [Botryotinia narcissicola]|uniref:Uncharacterized protein n=1 Tax=Botryotinia narcissicola TaxID=278944 RepID=A0A4Z1I1Y9_9HELO|nr:hypothetical protein BOTNAR_0240g00160 [Botryotinia narcissicola]